MKVNYHGASAFMSPDLAIPEGADKVLIHAGLTKLAVDLYTETATSRACLGQELKPEVEVEARFGSSEGKPTLDAEIHGEKWSLFICLR